MTQVVPFLPRQVYVDMGFGTSFWDAGDLETMWRVERLARQREPFRSDYGYVLATDEVMTVLSAFLAPLGRMLDAGCGSGYLAQELARRGVDVFAVDTFDPLVPTPTAMGRFPIRQRYRLDAQGSAPDFVTPEVAAVLLAWPPLKRPFALEVAQRLQPGQVLVYEGEAQGGCTANDAFFDYMAQESLWQPLDELTAALNKEHLSWSSLDDDWQVWRRL